MKNINKKVLNDISIKGKMLIALICCVIVPIMIMGLLVSYRVHQLNSQKQDESRLNLLTKLSSDIDNTYRSVIEGGKRLKYNGSIQSIVSERATVWNYQVAQNEMPIVVDSIENCIAITISKNGEVLFQRGNKYVNEKENAYYTDKIESGEDIIWPVKQKITTKKGYQETDIEVLTAYMQILNSKTMKPEGAITIYIDLEAFKNLYEEYLLVENSLDTFVIDSSGRVITEHAGDYKRVDYIWKTYQDMVDQNSISKDSGYFNMEYQNEKIKVIYKQCGGSDWYLVNVETVETYISDQVVFTLICVFFCILFGIVYAIIQNYTIIRPLKRLSSRIETVKNGVLEIKDYAVAHDEIGIVEKGFEDMVSRINLLIQQVYMQKIKTQEAEREMLLVQMNPHFLYNSLDSIHWLAIRNQDYEVSEQLEALADVYRYMLKVGNQLISIADEVVFIDNYIYLLEAQLGDRITFKLEIDEILYQYKIPKLIIQPLIENAIKHGLKEKKENGIVRIKIVKKDSNLEIIVADNGIGVDQKRIRQLLNSNEKKEAFALCNIHERICLKYGEGYGLFFYSKKQWGSLVKLLVKKEV